MLPLPATLAAVLLASAAAVAQSPNSIFSRPPPEFGCGTESIDEATQQSIERTIQEMKKDEATDKSGSDFPNDYDLEKRPYYVQTYFHIVAFNDSDKSYFEKHYNKANIYFELAESHAGVRPKWANGADGDEMRRELIMSRRYNDLNIYLLSSIAEWGPGTMTLGYATPPIANPAANDVEMSGAVIHAYSVLNNSIVFKGRIMNGGTVIHEVGHWLGLQHTFANGCEGNGDGIDDTPAQPNETYRCPLKRPSCKEGEFIGPEYNYMDYSYDSCMSIMTEGQFRYARDRLFMRIRIQINRDVAWEMHKYDTTNEPAMNLWTESGEKKVAEDFWAQHASQMARNDWQRRNTVLATNHWRTFILAVALRERKQVQPLTSWLKLQEDKWIGAERDRWMDGKFKEWKSANRASFEAKTIDEARQRARL
ncbi:hypothetical protein CDD80_5398 [Ophiocordyceps camponoti-rufipedis]|uniref:Peptidase M43 pregnancy-associated plasma-A domain-containing protein n=1 Tax=Ophiocordyceps camponoti-rufipedis TaxID=2004952 RepID=A0A2C5YW59_9HYPO|nr:hypothetical protein CDD80_5398 [Ophiocordyceps camponoti-rufipedis]